MCVLVCTLTALPSKICRRLHVHFMAPFWVVQQAAKGGLLHDPIVGGVPKNAQSLRLS